MAHAVPAQAATAVDVAAVASSSASAGNSESLVTALYLPLDKESIDVRLIILEPDSVQEAPVRCRLETVKLIDHPAYEALSWAWGDNNTLEQISLNDHMWMAPSSAVTALRYLRYSDRSRVLWIDALSINPLRSPDALRERESQIQIMRYVYSKAFRVVVWAGVPENNDELLPFIEKYFTGSVSLMNSVFKMGLRAGWFSTQIRRFTWWKRLWILQEVALASDTVICFGSLVASFDRLLRELATLQQALERFFDSERESSELQVIGVGLTGSVYVPRPQTFLELRQKCSSRALQYKMSPMRRDELQAKSVVRTGTRDAFRQFARYVVQFRYNGTSNPLDKLYGLLGLVPDEVGLYLNPRYDEDTVSMYRRTAAQIIRSSESLYILSQVHNISFMETTFAAELPSWVPDWTAKPYIDQEWAQARFREEREDIFDASGDAPCSVQTRDDHRILGLRGFFVDTVCNCLGGVMAAQSTFHEWWDQTLKWRDLVEYGENTSSAQSRGISAKFDDSLRNDRLTGAGDKIANTYVAGGSREHAFWRTMLHNTVFSLRYPGSEGITFFSEYKQANDQDVWADRQRLTLCSDETIKLCAAIGIAQAPVMEDAQLLAHVQRVTSNQGFLRTEDGFLGIGTKEIKPGDQVWVLAGGTHPFVLRECPTSPGHHTLVCEAYVDGVMLPGEIKNPYASLRVRREKKERGAYSMMEDVSDIWEQVWLR